MSPSTPSFWLPRLLRWLTLCAAATLLLLVVLAPLVDNGETPVADLAQVIALFARDVVLRRTAVASALGLTVTACVFFRVPAPARPVVRRPAATSRPASGPIIGA